MPEDFMRRISQVPVSATLLIQSKSACNEVANYGCSDITTRAMAMLSVVEDAQVCEQRISDTFTAITYRLEALDRLQQQENALLQAWEKAASSQNCGIRREHFFTAAALEPLVADGDRPTFDSLGFAQRLLDLASSRGVA
ncbi:MAG: hypothetical protein U1E16_12600 [Hyphomicrobiales bacterium]